MKSPKRMRPSFREGMTHMGQTLQKKKDLILGYFYFWNLMMFPNGYVLYIRWTDMTQGTRIWYMGKDLNCFQHIWALPVLRGSGPFMGFITYMQFDVPWHKEQE